MNVEIEMLLEQFPLREMPIGKGCFRSKLLKNYVETFP